MERIALTGLKILLEKFPKLIIQFLSILSESKNTLSLFPEYVKIFKDLQQHLDFLLQTLKLTTACRVKAAHSPTSCWQSSDLHFIQKSTE